MTIEIEGKWASKRFRKWVESLIEQGWEQVSIEPDAEFIYTTVVLRKI
jgi:hypothetical protein